MKECKWCGQYQADIDLEEHEEYCEFNLSEPKDTK